MPPETISEAIGAAGFPWLRSLVDGLWGRRLWPEVRRTLAALARGDADTV